MKKFINWLKSSKSDFVLFIVFLLLANIAGNNFYKRFDLTKPKSYSLSKASVNLVKNLEEPLLVRVFFDKNLPSPYNTIAQYVEDFLEEYESAANKNFNVKFLDVSKEENIQLAGDFGLRQVQIQEVKNTEVGFKQTYMGLVISYGDDIQLIDPIVSADGFEYKFTSTVSKMISTADTLTGLSADEKIKVTAYYSDSLKKMRIEGADEFTDLVRDAFASVNKKLQNRLELDVVSPSSPDAEKIAARYGLQKIMYNSPFNTTETALLSVVVEYGEKFSVLPISIQKSIFGNYVNGLEDLENNLGGTIQALVCKPVQIGYIMGHQELPRDEEKYAANLDRSVSKLYQFVELDLLETDIPSGINTIVINGPQMDYQEEELYKIDQFVMRGGNLMVFIDGLNTTGTNSYYHGGPQYLENVTNLDRLLNNFGVSRGYDMVFDKNCVIDYSSQYGKLNYYWAPTMQADQLAKNNILTKNLGYVTMLQNCSLDVSAARENPELKVTVLAESSKDSWISTDQTMMLNPMTIIPPVEPEKYGSVPMAVLLEGKFKSAFDGPVEIKDEDGNSLTSDLAAGSYVSSSTLPGKVFVAGSSYITTYQVFDEAGSTPIAMLIMNVVDYFNGNEDLCEMRTKGLSLSTLQVEKPSFAKFMQYFNEFGLSVLVALAGLFVWRGRARRKARINRKYNPNDTRTVEKKQKASKATDGESEVK